MVTAAGDSSRVDLAALLGRAAGGCIQSFEAVCHGSNRRLLAIILRINNNRGEGEEPLQDTYLKVWRQCGHDDAARGQPEHWLARIARNSAIDSLKRRSCRPEPRQPPPGDGLHDAYAGLACPAAGPCETLAQRRRCQALQHGLRALPPAQRETLCLAVYGDLSHREIAQQRGRPLGTIKSWLRRSLLGMKTALAGHL